MTPFETLSLIFSIVAIIFSAYSLHVSRAGSHLSWEREKKLPYYEDLNKFLKAVRYQYFGAEHGVYRKPDATDLSSRAQILGLSDCYTYLEQFMIYINELDEISPNDPPEALERAKMLYRLLEIKLNSLEEYVYQDIPRITKKLVLREPKYRT